MADVARITDWVVDWLGGGGRLLLLTDYDGTLTPIAASPEEAKLPPAVREDLQALARSPKVQIGVVSGRDLADLRAQVGISEAIYAGCYGLEVDGPGVSFRHPDAEAQRDTLGAIGRQLSQRASSVPGMRVESKRFGLALHYRHVPPEDVRRVEMELARAIRQDGSRLKIFHGAKVIEVQPQVGWTKGDCVLWIRDTVRRAGGDQVMLLYMGDDWTDEHAFEALVGQAITIRVGGDTPASRAAYRFADVAVTQRFLATLAARVGAESGA
jgi:trehalose 6-phosphate phosphatase